MFKVRPSRTVLTIFGVAVGIGAILFLVALGTGLQRLLLERITTDEALLSLDVSPPSSGILALDQATIAALAKIEHVEAVAPLASLSAQIELGELNADVIVNAVPSSYFRYAGITSSEGKLFREPDRYAVIVSNALLTAFDMTTSEALGKEAEFTLFIQKEPQEEEIGGVQEIEIFEPQEPYRIVGVVAEEIIPFVYLPLSSLVDIPIFSYSRVKVKVDQDKYLVPVRDEILARGFLVSSLSDTVEQANQIFRVVQIVLGIFGVISLI